MKDSAMAALIVWHLWKDRNFRVFQQKERIVAVICRLIEEKFSLLLEAPEY